MARKRKEGERPPGQKKTTTKVDAELLRKARMVALFREVDLFDYIDGMIRGPIERDYEQMFREGKKG
jgi:hypothetical protein